MCCQACGIWLVDQLACMQQGWLPACLSGGVLDAMVLHADKLRQEKERGYGAVRVRQQT